MNMTDLFHIKPGSNLIYPTVAGQIGQMLYHSAETGKLGGTISVTREEALAMAAAFAELAKDIEGSEKIAAQVRAISGQEDAA